MADEYRTVTAILRQRRANAIMIEHQMRPGWVSVPRSLIHGADDLKIGGYGIDEEITFRLRDWKAEQLGLAG